MSAIEERMLKKNDVRSWNCYWPMKGRGCKVDGWSFCRECFTEWKILRPQIIKDWLWKSWKILSSHHTVIRSEFGLPAFRNRGFRTPFLSDSSSLKPSRVRTNLRVLELQMELLKRFERNISQVSQWAQVPVRRWMVSWKQIFRKNSL